MVSIVNTTPFPHMRFSNSDNQGKVFGVLLIKAAFDLQEDGACIVAPEQEPINFIDTCHGVVNESSLRHPSDFVSYKPATDIILDCVAHAPGRNPAKTWLVGVRVEDEKGIRAQKILRIYGPRWWVPKWKRALDDDEKREWKKHRDLFIKWELSEPEPILSLPIRYEYAFGGLMPKGIDDLGKPVIDVFEHNPVGRGWIDPEWTDHTKPVAAPQIEFESEPISEPYKKYYPASFGPIPPAWLPRRSFGGTFDKNWYDTIRPKWPQDYNFSYNNSASLHLMADGFLQGDAVLTLLNLRKEKERFKIELKHTDLVALMDSEEGVSPYRLPLDTLFLEFAEDDLFECRLSATWRTPYRIDLVEDVLITVLDHSEPETKPILETMIAAPQPGVCGIVSDRLERKS